MITWVYSITIIKVFRKSGAFRLGFACRFQSYVFQCLLFTAIDVSEIEGNLQFHKLTQEIIARFPNTMFLVIMQPVKTRYPKQRSSIVYLSNAAWYRRWIIRSLQCVQLQLPTWSTGIMHGIKYLPGGVAGSRNDRHDKFSHIDVRARSVECER